MSLDALIDTINRELDDSVVSELPYQEAWRLPLVLRDCYSQSNGIRLPFLEIYPVDRIVGEFVPGWSCFGFDGYFSYCLCRESAIDLWDPESGVEPERSYSSVLELLMQTYRERIEQSDRVGRVVITAVPNHARVAHVMLTLKVVDARSTAELLTALKSLPVEINCPLKDGIRAVRALQAQGIACKLRIGTSQRR